MPFQLTGSNLPKVTYTVWKCLVKVTFNLPFTQISKGRLTLTDFSKGKLKATLKAHTH